MSYTDFAAVKARFPIEKVAELLGLTLKKSGAGYRAPCPACDSGGERALAITPGKGFYCWASGAKGDQLALAAHVRKCDVKDAAAWLDGTVPSSKKEHSTGDHGTRMGTVPEGLKPLELEHDHPAVEALGFSPEDAQALGLGYCGRGIMRSLVAIPIRLEDGTLAGYIGITEIAKLPPRWHGLPENKVVKLRA
jgi:hypothetical protein